MKKLLKNCWHKQVAHKMHTNTRYDENKVVLWEQIRSEVKHWLQNKSRYITLIHVADKTNKTIKTVREVGAVFAADRIQVDPRTQRVNNNNETQYPDNVISVGTNMIPITCNHVQQKTKFAQNVQNADTSQKFVAQQT